MRLHAHDDPGRAGAFHPPRQLGVGTGQRIRVRLGVGERHPGTDGNVSRATGGGVLQGALEPVAGAATALLQRVVDGVGAAVVVHLQEHVSRAQAVRVESCP